MTLLPPIPVREIMPGLPWLNVGWASHFAKVRDEHPVFWHPWLNAWVV
jgi:hypothetical protein